MTVVMSAIVLVPLAVADDGDAPSDDKALLGLPGTNTTVAVLLAEPAVAVTVLVSALVDAKVAVHTPDALVLPLAELKVFELPELDRVTA